MAFVKAGLWGPQAIIDATGHPQPGATAAVYLTDGVTLASLWTTSAKSVVMANPTQADVHGNLHFWADPGPYMLKVTVATVVTWLDVEVPIDPGEAAQDADVTAAIATAETYADGIVAAALAASLAGSQPLDADLTAIAALSTTAYGRAFLALADAAAGRTALGLGTAATHAVGDFDAAGAAAAAAAALVNSAPGTLDTLNELATALADDPAFATTVTNALAGKQPLDADLTAIAALSTTAFGRSALALVDSAALRVLAGTVIGTDVQAHDSDLDAIAALSTTAFGRALLVLADAAALRTAAGLGTAATAATTDFDAAGTASAAITALINGAPGALDTLNELATALGDDAAFATTVTNALATKLIAGATSGTANQAALPAAVAHTHEVVKTDDGGVYVSTGSSWVQLVPPAGTYAPATGIAESAVTGLVADLAAAAANPGNASAVGYLDATVAPYSVIADAVHVADGAMAAGSATLTSAGSAFTNALIGKTVNVSMPDRTANDGVTNSTTTLTSATMAFTANDVGKVIVLADTATVTHSGVSTTSGSATVTDASIAATDVGRTFTTPAIGSVSLHGPNHVVSVTPGVSFVMSVVATSTTGPGNLTFNGHTLTTTIASVTNSTTVELAVAAPWTGTAITVAIVTTPLHTTISAVPSGTTLTLAATAAVPYSAADVVYGTDNGAGIGAAQTAAAPLGRIVRYPAGNILCSVAAGSWIATVTAPTNGTAFAGVKGAGKDSTNFLLVARTRFTSDFGIFQSGNVNSTTTTNWSLEDFAAYYYGPQADDLKQSNGPYLLLTASGPRTVWCNRVDVHNLGGAYVGQAGQSNGVFRREYFFNCTFVCSQQVSQLFNNATLNETRASCGTTNGSRVVTTTLATYADVGKVVSGTGIVTGSIITNVTPGVNFSINQTATATGTVSLVLDPPLDHVFYIDNCHFENTDTRLAVPGDFGINAHIQYIHSNISFDIRRWRTICAKRGSQGQYHLHQNGGGNETPKFQIIDEWSASGGGFLGRVSQNGGYCRISNFSGGTAEHGIDVGTAGQPAGSAFCELLHLNWTGDDNAVNLVGPSRVVIDGFVHAGGATLVAGNWTGVVHIRNGTLVPGTSASTVFLPGAAGVGVIENVTVAGNVSGGSNPQYFARLASAGGRLVVRYCDISGTFLTAVISADGSATGADVFVEGNLFNTGSVIPIRDAVSTGTDGPLRGANNKFLGSVGPKVNGATRRRGNKLRPGRGVNPATIASTSALQLGIAGWNFDTHRITGTTGIDTMFLGTTIDETYPLGVPITIIANDAMVINSGSTAGSFAEALTGVAGHAYVFVFDQSLSTPLWVRVG